jgi:hypothetical protein
MRTQLRSILIIFGLIALTTSTAYTQTDSTLFYQVKGKIIDISTSDPVPSASIFIAGSGLGTVANMEGEFVLKIPRNYMNDSVVISSMGYESLVVGTDHFNMEQNLVELRAVPIPLEEVTIVNQDARSIIAKAIEKIRNNYSVQPLMVTTFYRENIRKGRKYVSVSEAVLKGYKASYTSIFDMDRVSIMKARKSSDFKNRDTVILKLQGGPLSMFQLDFVKDPGELLDKNVMDYYQYHLSGQTMIGNHLAHVISFHQLPDIEVPFYKGVFFVGVDDLAFLGAEFHLHEDHMDRAAEFMVQAEPIGAKIDIDKADYTINYRFFHGKWHLSYVRSEVDVKINWDKKLFNSTFTIKAEMAVTNVDSTNIIRFDKEDMVRSKDIFVEQVEDFEDPDFWGDYNIIRPEESIQSAIERMGRNISLSSPPAPGSNR